MRQHRRCIQIQRCGPIMSLKRHAGPVTEESRVEGDGAPEHCWQAAHGLEAPSRGLIGFRSTFATLMRGTGILHRAFSRYGPHKGPLDGVRKGVLISMACQQPILPHLVVSCSAEAAKAGR